MNLSEFDALLPKSRCGVARADLSAKQRAKLNAALRDSRYSAPLISRVVRAWGFELSQRIIWTHRTRRCSCG